MGTENKITIRDATVHDLTEIARMRGILMEETLYKVIGETLTEDETTAYFVTLVKNLFNPDHYVIVAEKEKKVIGYITGNLYRMDCNPKVVGFCDAVYIKVEHRGEGIASKLIDQLAWRGEKDGAMAIEFETMYHPKMEERWKRHGYTPIKIRFRKELL